MKSKFIFILIIFFTLHSDTIFTQTLISKPAETNQFKFTSGLSFQKEKATLPKSQDWMDQADAWMMFVLLYAINPIMSAEINGKLKWGWTKEISLGFGRLGQYRASVEYSWVDFENNQNIVRTGIKYDILLKSKINPNRDPVKTSVLTIGGGYFTNFNSYGYFPELSYGYSFRDASFLMYPSLKLRYTFMNEGPDIMDFSFGLVVGFANPFIHYDKPKKKKK